MSALQPLQTMMLVNRETVPPFPAATFNHKTGPPGPVSVMKPPIGVRDPLRRRNNGRFGTGHGALRLPRPAVSSALWNKMLRLWFMEVMKIDQDVLVLATRLVEELGETAVRISRVRLVELTAANNLRAAAFWRDVMRASERLLAEQEPRRTASPGTPTPLGAGRLGAGKLGGGGLGAGRLGEHLAT